MQQIYRDFIAAFSWEYRAPGVEEQSVCFVMRDRNGQALAYVYFEDEPPLSG